MFIWYWTQKCKNQHQIKWTVAQCNCIVEFHICYTFHLGNFKCKLMIILWILQKLNAPLSPLSPSKKKNEMWSMEGFFHHHSHNYLTFVLFCYYLFICFSLKCYWKLNKFNRKPNRNRIKQKQIVERCWYICFLPLNFSWSDHHFKFETMIVSTGKHNSECRNAMPSKMESNENIDCFEFEIVIHFMV